MRITFNNRTLELGDPMSLTAIIDQYYGNASGTALAINKIIIPYHQWPTYQVKDGDNILLFQAIAGG